MDEHVRDGLSSSTLEMAERLDMLLEEATSHVYPFAKNEFSVGLMILAYALCGGNTSILNNDTFYRNHLGNDTNFLTILGLTKNCSFQQSAIISMRLIAPDGTLIVGAIEGEEIVGGFFGDREWFYNSMNADSVAGNSTYFSSICVSRIAQIPAIRVTSPLEIDGKRIAVVCITFDATNLLFNHITDISYNNGGKSFFFAPNYENAEGDMRGELFLLNGHDRETEFDEDHAGDAGIDADLFEGDSGLIITVYKGEDYFFAYRVISCLAEQQIPRTYYVGLAMNTAEIVDDSQMMIFYYFLIVLFLSAVLIFFASYRFAATMTEPMHDLVDYARKTGSGDLTVAVPDNAIKRTDELGTLARSIGEMVISLGETQDLLLRKERLAVIGQLTGGVTHDLRNPLAAIKGAVEIMSTTIDASDEHSKRMLAMLDRQVTKCNSIIGTLLDFAHPSKVISQKSQINDVLRASLNDIKIPEGIEVIWQLDESLPTAALDTTMCTQAFENIIINSIQAMPEGGTLTLKSELLDPEWLAISVRDTGIGISKEVRQKLFQPLFTTKAKGIGLGLTIVETIVDAHGGNIDVQSDLGKGSVFTMTFPTSLSPNDDQMEAE